MKRKILRQTVSSVFLISIPQVDSINAVKSTHSYFYDYIYQKKTKKTASCELFCTSADLSKAKLKGAEICK